MPVDLPARVYNSPLPPLVNQTSSFLPVTKSNFESDIRLDTCIGRIVADKTLDVFIVTVYHSASSTLGEKLK